MQIFPVHQVSILFCLLINIFTQLKRRSVLNQSVTQVFFRHHINSARAPLNLVFWALKSSTSFTSLAFSSSRPLLMAICSVKSFAWAKAVVGRIICVIALIASRALRKSTWWPSAPCLSELETVKALALTVVDWGKRRREITWYICIVTFFGSVFLILGGVARVIYSSLADRGYNKVELASISVKFIEGTHDLSTSSPWRKASTSAATEHTTLILLVRVLSFLLIKPTKKWIPIRTWSTFLASHIPLVSVIEHWNCRSTEIHNLLGKYTNVVNLIRRVPFQLFHLAACSILFVSACWLSEHFLIKTRPMGSSVREKGQKRVGTLLTFSR